MRVGLEVKNKSWRQVASESSVYEGLSPGRKPSLMVAGASALWRALQRSRKWAPGLSSNNLDVLWGTRRSQPCILLVTQALSGKLTEAVNSGSCSVNS